MILDRKEFERIFPEDGDIYDLLTTKPRTFEELVTKYLPSKLWRLNNLYSIIDKLGDPIPFKMNRAQFKVYAKTLEHPRVIIL